MLEGKRHVRETIYAPTDPCGFAAWATGFSYADGRLGLSFTEICRERDPDYQPPRLEMGEAVGAPVSYCSAECGSPDTRAYRVYMASEDGARYVETGRCPLSQGTFCNTGLPDGRIVGLNVGKINESRTGWCDYISVRESADGGRTWRELERLLEGCAVYLWRLRKLRDGSVLVLASLYGTPWGLGKERATRNTMLPEETPLSKIQTFFLHSYDKVHYSGPHYILPGIGAHEYDVAELDNGDLLFVAGDVQATPVGRQIVRRAGKGSFINGPLLPIHRGAPPRPETDPQGGIVPETMVCLPGNLLVGARRNKPYVCSADLGANWYPVEGLPCGLYQPVLERLPQGGVICYGHRGGDSAVGQEAMYIGADRFWLSGSLPRPCTLELSRLLAEDQSHYSNRWSARLLCGGEPVANATVVFRFAPFWDENGCVAGLDQAQAPWQLSAVTDARGVAAVHVAAFDRVRDIHFSYNADALFQPEDGSLEACRSAMMTVTAMTPHRCCRHPYGAYFAGSDLFLSPQLEAQFPEIYETLRPLCGRDNVELNGGLREALLEAGVLEQDEAGTLHWIPAVHGSGLARVLPQGDGDWYI